MTRTAQAALVVWLLLLTGLFAVPVAGALYQARDPEYTCLVDRQAPPSNGVDYEWSVQARITPFPLGLECTFIRQSGEEIVEGPGWLLTLFAASAGAFGAASIAALVWRAPRLASSHRTVT
ncbi:hypothetical protein C5C86_05935 [Rathayibacter sp. AY1E4]|uniref:hypothetical protein n=1 Tax=Rathayibacter sp. AY1E4 TaxID=2080552 RepID=UPI000CE73C2E|nr:hypothetical protein [Rathayibacter sp. AY1E4]PPH41946.1 hypothetical protein C5C86_05935 [Rathayibacter sp. AY1E4]